MSLVIFCLLFSLVDYVPVKGEIIPVLLFKKKPPAVLSQPGWFCRFSRLLQVLGSWAQFSFFVFSAKEGGSVWATIITVAWFPALCPPSTLWPAPSTLWSCAWLVLIIHHALYPFDQSMRYRLEQIMPTILPPCWLGSCTHKVLAQFPFWKKSLWARLLLGDPAQFSTHSNSLASQESVSVTAHHGPPLLPAPGAARIPVTLLLSPSWSPLYVCAACLTSPSPAWLLFAFKSLLEQVCDFHTLGGHGAPRLLPCSPLMLYPWFHGFWHHAQALSLPVYKTYLLLVLKRALHILASKLYIS